MTTSTTRVEAPLLRLYRALLFLYPSEFRAEYGRELCLVFLDRYREKRSAPAVVGVWLGAVLGVLAEAPREHWWE